MLIDLTIWDFAAVVAKLLVYFGSFVAAGSILFTIANPSLSVELQRGLRRITIVAAICALIASIAQFGVQSGRLLDEGLSGMMDTEMLELVLNAPLGEAIFIRCLGLMLVLAFAFNIPVSGLFGAIGAVLIASSFSLVGHGTTDPRWLMTLLISIHLLAVSFWIGALYPLWQSANQHHQIIAAGNLAHRFGKQASYIVGGLIIAGLILIYKLVGSIELMFTTQYGFVLLIKLVVFAVILLLAVANKTRFVPQMMGGKIQGAMRLRRSITWESIVFGAVLAITAILTTVTDLPEKSDTMNIETSSNE